MSAAARLRALRGVPQRYRTDRRTFDRIVSDVLSDVLAELSEQFGDRVSNVSVMVEDWPTPAQLEVAEAAIRACLEAEEALAR